MNNRPLSKEYTGKRLLVTYYKWSTSGDPLEAKIFEVSPSGEYAKIEIKKPDNSSYIKWCSVMDYVVLEELEPEARVNMEWINELHEKEKRDREEFNKYSSPTSKPSYWDTLPTSVCSSDHYNISAQDPKSFTMHTEVEKQKWVHGVCNPPADNAKEYVKDCKSTGKRYNSVDQMIKDIMKQSKENK